MPLLSDLCYFGQSHGQNVRLSPAFGVSCATPYGIDTSFLCPYALQDEIFVVGKLFPSVLRHTCFFPGRSRSRLPKAMTRMPKTYSITHFIQCFCIYLVCNKTLNCVSGSQTNVSAFVPVPYTHSVLSSFRDLWCTDFQGATQKNDAEHMTESNTYPWVGESIGCKVALTAVELRPQNTALIDPHIL